MKKIFYKFENMVFKDKVNIFLFGLMGGRYIGIRFYLKMNYIKEEIKILVKEKRSKGICEVKISGFLY